MFRLRLVSQSNSSFFYKTYTPLLFEALLTLSFAKSYHIKFDCSTSFSARTFTWSYDMVIPLALALLPFLLFSAVIGMFVFCCSRWRVRGSQDLSDSSFWSEFSMPVSWILFLNVESKNHDNSRSDISEYIYFYCRNIQPQTKPRPSTIFC